jgi:hypothetical protein
MSQQVEITRTLLPSPTPEEPGRRIYKIQYRAGELPWAFVWILEKEWTTEKEAKMIREDIDRRLKHRRETISI